MINVTNIFVYKNHRSFLKLAVNKIKGEKTESEIICNDSSFSFYKKGNLVTVPYVDVDTLRRYHSSDDGESLIVYALRKKVKEFFASNFENGTQFTLFKKTLTDACPNAQQE